jgi:hypothetical protein
MHQNDREFLVLLKSRGSFAPSVNSDHNLVTNAMIGSDVILLNETVRIIGVCFTKQCIDLKL